MADLVVKLLLKSGAFSNDIKTAKGQIQNFQKGCKTAGQSVQGFTGALGLNVGALGKLGGAVGIAIAAGKEFKAIIDSSQTTADGFQIAISGAKGALDAFNTSLATGDFTMFREGLWQVIEDAKNVAKTLDQLGNTQIAFDYLSKENTTKFQEGYAAFKDPEATRQMKDDAKAQMKEAIDAQYEYAANYNKVVYENYVAQVIKKAGSANLKAINVTREQFRKAMLIDLSDNPQKGRDENEREYQKYKSQLKEYGKNNIMGQEDLKKRYADVIAIHAMLELMKDDELKGLGDLLGGMEMAKQTAISMQKTYNRAVGKDGVVKTTNDAVKVIKEEITAQKDSLEYWRKLQNEAQKHRDAEVFNSDSWNKYNDELKKAKNKVEEIEQAIAKLNRKNIEPLPELDRSKLVSEAKVQDTTINIKANKEDVDGVADSLTDAYIRAQNLNTALGSIGNMFGSLSNLASSFGTTTGDAFATVLDSLGTISQGIQQFVQIQQAAAMASGTASAAGMPFPYNIAAIATVISTIASVFTKIKSVGNFANGGIVGGSSFTGDRLQANVNSGEMILNRAQQSNLWRQINTGTSGVGQVQFHISGTDLVGVLNNNNRKARLTR